MSCRRRDCGAGDLLDEDGYSVRVLHGFHLDVGLSPQQIERWKALQVARAAFDADFLPPVTPEEDAATAGFLARGVHTPEVNTEGTLTYIIDIGGFRIAYRDSGGPISEEERRYFTANPGVDLADPVAQRAAPRRTSSSRTCSCPWPGCTSPRC